MSNPENKSVLSADQIKALMGPLNKRRILSRSIRQDGSNVNLSYLAAWDVKATLTRVFGFGGFSAEVLEAKILQVREVETTPQHVKRDGSAKTPMVMAQSTVRLTIFGIGPNGEDAVYTETAVGDNSGFDIGPVADNAIKSASSDALKRAATYLGTQFGLSLYAKTDADVIRVLLNPAQADLWKQDGSNDKATQEALDRATGQIRETIDAVAEDAEILPGEDTNEKAEEAP